MTITQPLEHPDYLTMAQIVNGNDDLDLPIAEFDEYVKDTIGFDMIELTAMSHVEVRELLSVARNRLSKLEVGRATWAMGFLVGLRISRGITTDEYARGVRRGPTDDRLKSDPYLGVDQESILTMAFGRSMFMCDVPDMEQMAAATWVDGAMVGAHFDRARITETS